MSRKYVTLCILIMLVSACSRIDRTSLALEEIRIRNLSYDISGLKQSTFKPNDDGAYLFKDAGFFKTINDEAYKELLIHAAKSNNYGLVLILSEKERKVSLEPEDIEGYLNSSIEKGYTRTVRLLLRHGAKPNSDSLFKSVYKNNYDLSYLLIEHGAPFDRGENKKALNVAARIGHLKAVRAFVENKKPPKDIINKSIILAALTEKIEVVKYLVSNGVDVNYTDKDGCTALHYLSQDGSVDMIKYMVESGALVNKTCRGKETPLTWAYYGKNTAVINYLLNNGAINN